MVDLDGTKSNGYSSSQWSRIEHYILRSYRSMANPLDWQVVGEFVRGVVIRTRPSSVPVARLRISAVTDFVVWANRAGHPMNATSLFKVSLIDQYLASRTEKEQNTRAGMRGNLYACAPRNVKRHDAEAVRAVRGPVHKTYTEAQLNNFLNSADALSTDLARRRMLAFISLTAGAGLMAQEIDDVRCGDVTVSEEGVEIAVRGSRARTVTVLRKFESIILGLLTENPNDSLGDVKPESPLYRPVRAIIAADPSVFPDMKATALRSTWIATLVEAKVPLAVVQRAAGAATLQFLEDFLVLQDDTTPDEERVLLREAGDR